MVLGGGQNLWEDGAGQKGNGVMTFCWLVKQRGHDFFLPVKQRGQNFFWSVKQRGQDFFLPIKQRGQDFFTHSKQLGDDFFGASKNTTAQLRFSINFDNTLT